MCDCYSHKCEECDNTIPMHIGDFAYPQEDFKCYCKKHIDKAPKGSVIFEVMGNASEHDKYDKIKKGWKCAIFGPEVGESGMNHPNIASNCKETII